MKKWFLIVVLSLTILCFILAMLFFLFNFLEPDDFLEPGPIAITLNWVFLVFLLISYILIFWLIYTISYKNFTTINVGFLLGLQIFCFSIEMCFVITVISFASWIIYVIICIFQGFSVIFSGLLLIREDRPKKEIISKEFVNERMRLAYAFMIVGTVVMSFFVITLCWSIPLTLKTKKLIYVHETATALGICSILFVSIVGGILLLVANNSACYVKNTEFKPDFEKIDLFKNES